MPGLSLIDLVNNRDNILPKDTVLGIYRAIVKDNNDPEKRLRLKVLIPSLHPSNVSVSALPWADCCSGVAGPSRCATMRPKIGDVVYVMFEMGDKHYPVWIGSWFAAPSNQSELPKILQDSSEHYLIRTDNGNLIDISDESGRVSINISTKNGNKIVLDDTGNKIDIIAGETNAVINIKSSITGSINLGNTPLTPCNDLPICPILGRHSIGTDIPGNRVMVP
jgi:uncharacterized protein involved in type VI secretion and phage assembly